jgi:hypothetical protein
MDTHTHTNVHTQVEAVVLEYFSSGDVTNVAESLEDLGLAVSSPGLVCSCSKARFLRWKQELVCSCSEARFLRWKQELVCSCSEARFLRWKQGLVFSCSEARFLK